MNLSIKESSTVEFKSTFPQKGQLAKTCVAFCNHHGGRIYIGISDSAKVIGLPEADVEEKMEFLGQYIYQACSPPILPQIYSINHDGSIILVIEVSAGMNKPYFLTKDGMNQGTYIRVGRSTLKASADSIQELQWMSRGICFDELPCYHVNASELEKSGLNQWFEKNNILDVSSQEGILRSLKVFIDEHGKEYISNGGVLLFGHAPQQIFSESFIICTRFKGDRGREVLCTQDIEGSLLKQIEGAILFIRENIGSSSIIKDVLRDEYPRLPLVAIREGVINAIAHRTEMHRHVWGVGDQVAGRIKHRARKI